jgi:hypothetical protein
MAVAGPLDPPHSEPKCAFIVAPEAASTRAAHDRRKANELLAEAEQAIIRRTCVCAGELAVLR